MWHNCKMLVFLLSLVCILGGENGGCLAFDEAMVTRDLQTSFDCHKSNPAVAVAVVKDGKTLYSRGFGYTTVDKKTPVTDETIFGVASISKSFAAALFVKQLYEKTKFTINSKVRELLGDEFVLADDVRTREATFLDFLSHKMAIPSNNRIRLDTNLTRDNLLSRLRHLKSNKQFRVDFVYSNLIYGLIGRMSEILGGHPESNKRWEDLISENFFQPLGMSKSTFATRINYTRDDFAKGYSEIVGPGIMTKVEPELSRRWAELCASGAIMSSVKDMASWLNFHLSLGKNGTGHQIMDEKLVEELHKPRIPIESGRYLGIEKPTFPLTVMESAYAMGLKYGRYRGYRLLAHTGGTYGYNAYMTMLPSEKIGVIILTTGRDSYTRHRASVTHYLLDNALNIQPYINSATICTYPKPWVTKKLTYSYQPKRSNESLNFNIKEYEGAYSETAYGNLAIWYNSTVQSVMMQYGFGVWELMVWPESKVGQEQRFYAKVSGAYTVPNLKPFYFIEHPDKKGSVVGLRATGFETKVPPIFCKEEHKEVCEGIRAMAYPKEEAYCQPDSATSLGLCTYRVFILLAISLQILLF